MAEKLPRVFGSYTLEKLLSTEGGQGVVYLATHRTLEKRVVIKILKDHLAKHESFVDRFAAEAAQLARMDHTNIVRVRQTGPLGDEFFIEMELIEGWDLSGWLKQHGRLPAEIAVLVLQRFAAGLQHAHERSIIHRDVKPGNVMLTTTGEVKVLDFGLARDMDSEGRSTPGTLMGTYAYMSPEQVDGEEATFSFDVYSLGVVAYQLLANKIPFEGTIATVCMKIKNEEPVPLDKLVPETPPELVKLVQRLMAKRPSQRPRDMREVEQALRDIAHQMGLKSSEDLLSQFVTDPVATSEKLARRRLRRRWRPFALAGAAAAAIIILGASMTAVLRRPPAQHPVAAAPAETVAVTPAPAPAPAAPARSPAAVAESLAAAETAAKAVAKARADSILLSQQGSLAGATVPGAPEGESPAVTQNLPAGTLNAAPGAVPTTWSADSLVLDITVSPPSDIYLDGWKVATGASRWTARAVRKQWTVRVDGGDYGVHEQKKKPKSKDTVLSFNIDLAAGEGGVYVDGPRTGLDIYIDGVYQRASTPSPVRPVKVGPHLVEVRDRNTGVVLGSRKIAVKDGPGNILVDFTPGR